MYPAGKHLHSRCSARVSVQCTELGRKLRGITPGLDAKLTLHPMCPHDSSRLRILLRHYLPPHGQLIPDYTAPSLIEGGGKGYIACFRTAELVTDPPEFTLHLEQDCSEAGLPFRVGHVAVLVHQLISIKILSLVRVAAARTTTWIALAIRPHLPIAQPMSSSATCG